MVYVRGHERDYSRWEQAGNPGWGYKDVLEYFKKSESSVISDKKHHNADGLLRTEPFASFDPLNDAITNAAVELGYEKNDDINGENIMGFCSMMGTIKNGQRHGPATAFLSTAKDRKNLHVIKNAYVSHIEISDSGRVENVKFRLGDQELTAMANKEVILSAGAINSPQILMNSGIGPKSHLEAIGIPVKVDLPVGENLQDHAIVYLPLKFHKRTARKIEEQDLLDHLYLYLTKRIGRFTNHGTTELTGFVNTLKKNQKYPDIQYHFFEYRRGEEKRLKAALNLIGYEESVKKSFLKSVENEDLVMAMVVLLNPKSAGRVELRSKNPFDKPRIFSGYLEVEDDTDTFVRGIKVLLEMFKTESFKKHEADLERIDIPGCRNIQYNTDSYWKCYVRHLTATVYHPVGTCKMGPNSDPKAVVDSRLNVKGVKGLRVIDASIMPDIVSGNTNAPSIMIGERGSQFIKESYNFVKNEL
jgi:choline dehydrogenase